MQAFEVLKIAVVKGSLLFHSISSAMRAPLSNVRTWSISWDTLSRGTSLMRFSMVKVNFGEPVLARAFRRRVFLLLPHLRPR